MTKRKPSLQEVLDATAQVLRFDGREYLADEASLGDAGLEAVVEPGSRVISRPEAPVDDVLLNLSVAFGKIARAYQDSALHRKPRLSELLEGLAFVLRGNPERVLRDAEGLKVQSIQVAKP
jgi:hypothetical protein